MAEPESRPDEQGARPTSRASRQLVRLLILESLATEQDRERYAQTHGACYLLPSVGRKVGVTVDATMMTPDGPALAQAFLRYIEAPVPWGQELLARLEARDAVLCRRYVSYLALRRDHGLEGAAGVPAALLQTIAPGRSVRTIESYIQQAEELLVDLVHKEHMRQIALRVVPHPPEEQQDP